jgi:hypothetical protein
MSNNYVLSKPEKELAKRLNDSVKEYDLKFGVMLMCHGEAASKRMLQYMDDHPDSSVSDWLEFGTYLCEKYQPEMLTNENE